MYYYNLLICFQIPRPLLPTPHGGLVPGFPPPGPPGMMPPPLMAMGGIHPAPHVEPPSAKKPRPDDNLIPEQEFISSHSVGLIISLVMGHVIGHVIYAVDYVCA